jgi:hypothetical protein
MIAVLRCSLFVGVCLSTMLLHAEQRLVDFRRVVIADDAGAVAKAAADEIATYAGRIVDGKLDVIPWSKYSADDKGLSFFIGAGVAKRVIGEKLAPWKDEEYLLRTVPRGLVLAGHDAEGNPWSYRTAAGSMLATYVLLDDHLGCRWFWPGPFGEHVPQNPDAVVPELNVRAAPKFTIRSVLRGYSTYHTRAFKDASERWARRSRLA